MTCRDLPYPVAIRVWKEGPIPPEKNTPEVWMAEASHWYEQLRQTQQLLDQLREASADSPTPAAAPLTDAIADATTPEAVADASRKVAHLLLAGQIQPEQGRTALYALQICMTALRFTESTKTKWRDGRPRPSTRAKRGRATPAAKKKTTNKRGTKP